MIVFNLGYTDAASGKVVEYEKLEAVWDEYSEWLDHNVKKWRFSPYNSWRGWPRAIYLYDEDDAIAFALRFRDVVRGK